MEIEDVDDFFSIKYQQLKNLNYVNETFKEAISKREVEFPTGLKMESISIAIPHTDVIHIKEPFVSINRLKNKIDFIQMGTDDERVAVQDIIILGIKDPKKQVSLLSNLMELFSEREFVLAYKKANTSEEIIELVQKKWQEI